MSAPARLLRYLICVQLLPDQVDHQHIGSKLKGKKRRTNAASVKNYVVLFGEGYVSQVWTTMVPLSIIMLESEVF